MNQNYTSSFFIFMAERFTCCTWSHPTHSIFVSFYSASFHSAQRDIHTHTFTFLIFSKIFRENKNKKTEKNMSDFCLKNGHSFALRRRLHSRVSLLRRCILRALHRLLVCSGKQPGANATYSMLTPHSALPSPRASLLDSTVETAIQPPVFNTNELDTDLVSLKISLLGDCQIGKTSFLVSLSSLFLCP